MLDACAAPGGKTGYLAELMKNQGAIMACDRDEGRIGTLRDNLERLGVEIARFAQHDWTSGGPAAGRRGAFFLRSDPGRRTVQQYGRDAPPRGPSLAIDFRTDFSRMREEQLRILRATIPLLKIGGVLVYSTCSIEPDENEEVVQAITQEFPFLKFVEQVSLLPFRNGFDGAFAAKLVRAA